MAYLKTVSVVSFRNLANVQIDLECREAERGRNLILTGPNGSGKSSLLDCLRRDVHSLDWSCDVSDFLVVTRDSSSFTHSSAGVTVATHPGKTPDVVMVYFKADRKVDFARVKGPVKESEILKFDHLQKFFIQFLVNQRFRQLNALEKGDEVTRKRIADWFERLEGALRDLYGDGSLVLEFDLEEVCYFIKTKTQRSSLYHLADGHRSSLQIFAELLLQTELKHPGVPMVVLIDEIETHLHLELQETILPFLIKMFPTFQFIVATHSPAVIASIPDAVVYDLATKEQTNSSDYQGMRYGTLMKAHFGLDEDFDLATTKELQVLKALRRKDNRTEEETRQLLDVANRLSAKSHMAALEVLVEMEAQKVAP